MATNYAYYYAIINANTGMCTGVRDTSDYVLNPCYVPIEVYDGNYLLKYYHPIPEAVESFEDFQGSWYSDAAHTIPWTSSLI